MKILHVIPAVAKRYGGPSAVVVEMCRALNARGLETLVATTDADGDAHLPVSLGVITEYAGTKVIVFRRVASESFKYSPALAAWLRVHVTDFDAVHIHAVMSHACVAAATASRRAGVPYIVRPLGTLDPWSLSQNSLRKRIFMAASGQAMLRDADAIHCTSPGEASSVRKVFGLEQTVTIPLGIDDDAFGGVEAAADAGRPPYVLSMSRLHPKKRVETLIAAFARATLTDDLAAWRLVIAGDGDPAYVEHLRAVARVSSAHERIAFVGWTDGERKRELVRHASLFALASRHENFGVSVLEALAAAVPVVMSTEVQLAPWVEEAGAGWLTPLDAEGLTTALHAAMADAPARRERGASAQRLAERFRWPVVAGELTALYQRVVSARPTRTPSCAASLA